MVKQLAGEEMKKIRDYFSQRPEVAAVYLYGSFARGTARKDSDLDLGLVFVKKELAPFSSPEIKMATELEDLIGRKVEVQDLAACRMDFAHRVIGEGRLIYSRDETKRVSFEEQVLRDYFLLKPALDEYYFFLAEIARRGELDVRYL